MYLPQVYTKCSVEEFAYNKKKSQFPSQLCQYLTMACRTHVISGLEAWLSVRLLTVDSDRQLPGLIGLSGGGRTPIVSGSGLDADRLDTTDELRLTPQKHFLPDAGSVLPRRRSRASYWCRCLRLSSPSGSLLMSVLLLFCCKSGDGKRCNSVLRAGVRENCFSHTLAATLKC